MVLLVKWALVAQRRDGLLRHATVPSVAFPNPELAFSLMGSPVPEPSSIALAAVGFVGLAWVARWLKPHKKSLAVSTS